MEPRDNVIADLARTSGTNHQVVAVDFGELVASLLLFDEGVIRSTRLLEFPQMLQKFGFEAVRELLDSGRARFFAQAQTFGSIGRTTALASRAAKGSALPAGSFSFATLQAHDYSTTSTTASNPSRKRRGCSRARLSGLGSWWRKASRAR